MGRLLAVLGRILLGLVVLIVLAVGGVWFNAQRVLGQRYDNPVPPFSAQSSPERVDRGAYLVTAYPGCAGCHASNPAARPPVLDGALVADAKPLGDLYAPNLTPAALRDWSDGEIVRAVREGVGKDGRGLALMPSEDFRELSDDDMASLIAYLRSQPPVQNVTPKSSMSALGTALVGLGQLPPSRQAPTGPVTSPPRGPTADYGRHLARVSGCTTCHGPALDGKNVPNGPPNGGSLAVVKGWTPEQFQQTLRTGVDPTGHRLADTMPWRQYGQGTDDDIRALYEFLKSVP